MGDVFALYREALEKGHEAVSNGRPRDALTHYEEAATIAPARATPHVCIAGVLVRTGRLDEALAAYDRALELAPDDSSALNGKAAALAAAGRAQESSDLEARVDDAERRGRDRRIGVQAAALTREAQRSGALSRPEVLHFSAEQSWLADRPDAAIEQWLEAARAYADAGHPDAALESAESALLAAPASPRVHLEMSRLYIRRGWIDRAAERLELIERLLQLAPDAVLAAQVRDLAAAHARTDPRLAALASRAAPEASPPGG